MAKIAFDTAISEKMDQYLTPYVERRVTHFTSRERDKISSSFFNLSKSDEIPEKIFTTVRGAADPEFYSIEADGAQVGGGGCDITFDNMYRVVTDKPVGDDMIGRLLGKPANKTLEDMEIEWVHRQAWPYAFPIQKAKPLPGKVEILPNLFYTSVGEELVSSLEMSCRVGRLVGEFLNSNRCHRPPWEEFLDSGIFPNDPDNSFM